VGSKDPADRREREALGGALSGPTRPSELVVVAALALPALAGGVAAVGGRGADDAFLLRQENPTQVTAAAVERLIRTAPDPAPPHKSPAVRSRCRPEGGRELRNPWRCVVRYRSGSVARFKVTIKSDGGYLARYGNGPATATGCCLQ
jgi:hypothetical protein